MRRFSTVNNLRVRYVIGLSAIALLVTASFFTMQKVVSEQRDFSSLVNLAGHQAGLANRISYFSSLMATTTSEKEYNTAKSQVGRTINKMKAAHEILRNGDSENGIPVIINENLKTIYEDPMVGLDLALKRFLQRATEVYDTEMEDLTPGSGSYVYLTTYGPHVLEPLLDAAVDEYQKIGKEAILTIEKFEKAIWLATLFMLLVEVGFIFLPLENHVRNALTSREKSIKQLEKIRERLLAAQQLALIGDWELDISKSELTWSDQIYQVCGVAKERFEVTIRNSMSLIHPEDQKLVQKRLSKLMSGQETSMSMEYRIVRPDKSERLVYQYALVVTDSSGKAAIIKGTIQDITARMELSTRLEKLSEHVPGFIFQFHVNAKGLSWMPYASTGIYDTCGLQPTQVSNSTKPLLNLLHQEDLERIKTSIALSAQELHTWHDEFRIFHPHKGYIWLEGHATPEKLPDHSILWHGYIWDITERKVTESKIRKLALFDPLTGLANRRLLADRIGHAIATSKRNLNYGAVIMLDLDNFKTLNDTKGHDLGDELLIEVAERLQACLRDTDTIARLGGDEFVVILEWLGKERQQGQQKALEVAEKIRVALARPYILSEGEHTHHGSASIGVTLFNDHEKNQSELLKMADVAMYEAKDLGKNKVCFYSDARQAVVNKQTEIAHNMQVALINDEFSLYFQPQVTGEGNICGAEALIRWLPAGKEHISPGSFIPIAEKTGLILQVGQWVLEKSCNYICKLENYQLPPNFTISVNISARQFSDESFLDNVRKVLKQTGVNISRLKFELTESCLVQDLNRGRTILLELQEMGIRVDLDDFGTGYSSLNALNNLPLHTLKLDRTLVNAIEDASSKAIVKAAIAMAKAMSMEIIAEGVETREQQTFLVEEGCDMLQGFLFARPMPFPSLLSYLNEHVPAPSPPSQAQEIPFPAIGNMNGHLVKAV